MPCNASNLKINQKLDDAGSGRFQVKEGDVVVSKGFYWHETRLKNRVLACG